MKEPIECWSYNVWFGQWLGSFGWILLCKKHLAAWVLGFEVWRWGVIIFIGPLALGIGTILEEEGE